MKIEHTAIHVADPPAVAAWYVQHLGLSVRLALDEPPYTRFLADDGGHVMIELYHNPIAPVPDYWKMHDLVLHLALVSADVPADRDRLIAAGATLVEELRTDAGDDLCMLRDPWGFAIQLCRRASPMI